MQIVNEYPPIYEQAAEVFPLSGNEIFAWGDTIYYPKGGEIPVWLIGHEKVHSRQQGGNPEVWWSQYLVDTQFRYEQELEAHQVEYRVFCKNNKDRNKQVKYLHAISRRLASPMYGSVVNFGEAMRRIKHG